MSWRQELRRSADADASVRGVLRSPSRIAAIIYLAFMCWTALSYARYVPRPASIVFFIPLVVLGAIVAYILYRLWARPTERFVLGLGLLFLFFFSSADLHFSYLLSVATFQAMELIALAHALGERRVRATIPARPIVAALDAEEEATVVPAEVRADVQERHVGL